MNKQGDMQVWWIPQVPMKTFEVNVASIEEAIKIKKVLARYDKFQFKNNIKPDCSNTGGLCIYYEDSDGEENPRWIDRFDEEIGEDDPNIYLRNKLGGK